MASEEKTKKTHLGRGQTVLVTGAAGGVGRHVVRAALDAGLRVRAADRVKAEAVELHGLFDPEADVDWRAVELAATDLEALTDGCQAVIHCAALVSLSESYTEIAGVNVRLVRELYRACEENAVEHMVHFSCGAVYRPGPGVRVESDALWASNAYEQSKIDSERVFPHRPEQTRWTILRPALVYGPHCAAMSAGIATLPPLVRALMPYLPGITGGPRTNWCYVEDAASAALAVLGNEAAFEQTFNVADDTALGFGEAVTSITEAYRLEVGALVPFPNTTLWTALSPLIDHDIVFDVARKLLRRRWRKLLERQGLKSPLRPRVDRNALFYVERDNILGADALKTIGWRSKYNDFREGISETIRWYQQHGWAPRFDTQTQVRIQDEKQTLGLRYNTGLSGYWVDSASGEKAPVTLRMQVEFPSVTRFARELDGNIDGRLSIEGLAKDAIISGTVRIRLLSETGMIWEMGFEDASGAPYRLKLVNRLSVKEPLGSVTAIYGDLVDGSAEPVGHIHLNFDLRGQFLPSLLSVRLLH